MWTAENGVKTIATSTYLTQFWATEDGSQIAFSANAVGQATTDIVVTTAAAPDITTPVITGANAENITVNTDACPTQFGFAGTTFVGVVLHRQRSPPRRRSSSSPSIRP